MSRERRPYRIAYRDELTPRQREVLALIARGKTNAQVADQLGVGYETVKTHVAEILGKLGVDSREEAAAVYREQQRPGYRLSRAGHRVLALAATRAALLATGGVVLFAAAALAAAFILAARDGDSPVATDETPSPTLAPTRNASPSATTPALTPSPNPVTPVALPSVVAGKPVKELVAGPPVEFPDDLVLYLVTSSCYDCGPGLNSIWRVYRDGAGELIADSAVPPETGEVANVTAYWQSPDGYEVYAGLCTGGSCGGESDPSPDASLQLVRSGDGGITWEELGIPPFEMASVSFVGAYNGEVLASAAYYRATDRTYRLEAFLVPSMTPVELPAGLPPSPDGDAFGARPMLSPAGELMWVQYPGAERRYFDGSGQPAPLSPELEAILPDAHWTSADGDVWRGQRTPVEFFGPWLYVEIDDSGIPQAGYTSAVDGLDFRARMDATQWIGVAYMPTGTGPTGDRVPRPVLIDTETATVHTIRGLPPDDSPVAGNFSWPRLAIQGDFVRVATGGSCLNVRPEPDTASAVLDCYADGVLLKIRDAEASAGWLPVLTTGGRPGFGASEFVER